METRTQNFGQRLQIIALEAIKVIEEKVKEQNGKIIVWSEEDEDETPIFDMPSFNFYGKHGFQDIAYIKEMGFSENGFVKITAELSESGEDVFENLNSIDGDFACCLADYLNEQ